jgi:bifunctional DNase/RNase
MRYHGSVLFDLSPSVEEIVELQELHQRLFYALDALTPADSEAVLLFYYQNMSIREAAALLHTSPGALRVRLHKARNHLRKHLLTTKPVQKSVMEAQIMFPVEVLEVTYLEQDNQDLLVPKYPIILLLDEPNERVLPIWVGPHEGEVIQLILSNSTFPRPMTWSFMSNLLDAVGAQVESVLVSKLVNEVYYAITKLRYGDVVHEVDSRPSDAIALALNTQSPIFVAEEVISTTGMQTGEQFKASLAERRRMSRTPSEEMVQRFSAAPPSTETNLPSQEEREAAARKAQERIKAIIGQ